MGGIINCDDDPPCLLCRDRPRSCQIGGITGNSKVSAIRKSDNISASSQRAFDHKTAVMHELTAIDVIAQAYDTFLACTSKTVAAVGALRQRSIVLAASLLAFAVLAGLVSTGLLPRAGADIALATVAAVGIAAFISALVGFAFSAICGAFLFHFRHDTIAVVQIMLICSIANQSLSVWALRRHIRLQILLPFLAGGLVGVPIGVWLLLHFDVAVYVKGVGMILLIYGLYMLVRRPMLLRYSFRAGDILAGIVGGLTGGFAATPGFPVSAWCSMKGWDKVGQRAVFQPFILLMQIIALSWIAIMTSRSASGIGLPPIVWACVPAGLVGTSWGLNRFQQMTDRQFAAAVNVLLIASGAALLL